MISEEKISEVVTKIATRFNPEKIILFGSYAAGNPTPNSDLDLLIIQETDLPKQQRGKDIRLSLIGARIPIDILVYTLTEFISENLNQYSFVSSAMKTSKVLYERTN